MSTSLTRKVVFKSPVEMRGKEKYGNGNTSDEESLAKADDDRDLSHLKDLAEKAEANDTATEDSQSKVLKKPNKSSSKTVDETKTAIPLERQDSYDNEELYSLHQLASEGEVEDLAALLRKLSENPEQLAKAVNEPDDETFTPLHYAARYNEYQAAKLLIRHGADVKAKAEGDVTPLHYCARYKPPLLSARPQSVPDSSTWKNIQVKPADSQSIGKSKDLIGLQSDRDTDEYFTCRQSLWDSARLNSRFSPKKISQNQTLSPLTGRGDDNNVQRMFLISLLIDHGADIEAVDAAGQTPLHYAASQAAEPCAIELLEWKANVNSKDRQLQTPLHAACSTDSVLICRQLLDRGAVIDERNAENKTPLHVACQFGKFPIVQLLLDQMDPSMSGITDQAAMTTQRMQFGQYLDARDQESNTPLLLAVESRSYTVADLLLKRGADVNALRKGGIRCLHLASQNGDVAMIDLLIDYGAKVDCRNSEQQTPMHLACARDKKESVQCLIKRGADVRIRDKQGRTPLLLAVVAGSLSCVKVIIKKSLWTMEDTDKSDRTALFLAARHNRLDMVKYLLTGTDEEGGDKAPELVEGVCALNENAWIICRGQLEYPDRDGNTPLHIAAMKGYTPIVEYLLANGANSDAENEDEKLPIHLAAEEGCVGVVRFLAGNAKSRKTIFDQDEDSNTPLHLAAKRGNALVAKVLLQHGADVKARNSKYWTPLDYAVERGWSTTTSILLDHKAPVNTVDKTKSTPLHIACKSGQATIVNMLLKQKADVKALDCDNRTCLDLAIKNDHKDVIVALLAHPDWRSTLTHAHVIIPDAYPDLKMRQTPLRALIRKFPDLAQIVFDKCTKVSKLPPEHPDFEITYDYELLEDSYSHWEPDQPETVSYDETNHLRPDVRPYSENRAEVKNFHPLMIMVRREREELLDHPLVRNLLKHKWSAYGRHVYYGSLLVYLLYLFSITAYVASAKPPYLTFQSTPISINTELDSELKDFCTRILDNSTTIEGMVVDYAFTDRAHVLAIKYLIFVLSIFNIIKEGVQMYLRRLMYFSFENCIELFVYVAGFIFVIDFTPCSHITGYRMGWQWQVGAFAVFLAWFNLILFASKLPRYGIYVVMFLDVSKTFSQFFVLYFLFIVAFALTFFALFQNQHAFSTIEASVIKTMVMMVGEFDYEGIFTPTDQSYEEQLFYNRSSRIFFAAFVVIMTILVMNLLIGLAVDDIKSIQQQAVLKRLALQVEQVLEVEQLVPERFLRRWIINQETIYPNKRTGFKICIKNILLMFGKVSASQKVPGVQAVTQGELAERKLRSLLESTNSKLDQLTRTLEDVQKEQRGLKKLVMALSEKKRGDVEREEETWPLF